ncbi:MAG: hypothetical protein LBK71_07635 [Verrucomicrobiales bacterium]|jgi:hypothetical protein|nr:hypothetical protein [Verrucomicrobiales bacterium]
MKKLVFYIILEFVMTVIGYAGVTINERQENEILRLLKPYVSSMNHVEDIWETTVCGGYIFRFSLNIIEETTPEIFINFSGEPGRWHVFIDGNLQQQIEFGFALFYYGGGWFKPDGKSCITVGYYEDRHSQDEPYLGIHKERITKHGVQLISHRKTPIRSTVPQNDEIFTEIKKLENAKHSGEFYAGFKWIKPEVEYILIYDFLTQEKPQWEIGWPDSRTEQVYYRFKKDNNRIEQLIKIFTPEIALELITKKLGAKDLSEKKKLKD